MTNTRLISVFFTIAGSAFLLSGCGGGQNSVSGEVKMDGKPLGGAQISFQGTSADGGAFSGVTDEQGKFNIVGNEFNKIKAGSYKVFVSKKVDKTGKVPDPEEYGQLEAANELKELVPQKYNDPANTELKATINDGHTELKPFELKSK